MRKFQAVLLGLLALLALSALVATTASAETTLPALWLRNGNHINAGEVFETQTEGSILLEDTKAGPFGEAAAVLCSGILDGTVTAEGVDEITKVLNLKGEEISSTPLTGLALLGGKIDCEREALCEEGTDLEVWPENLPWKTQLFLMENGEILDLIEKAAYELTCLVLGFPSTDLCELADTELPVENNVTTGDAGTPALAIATPRSHCELGGEETGVNETDEFAAIKLVNGELLTVSSE